MKTHSFTVPKIRPVYKDVDYKGIETSGCVKVNNGVRCWDVILKEAIKFTADPCIYMISEPRPIRFRTILETAKAWPGLFRMTIPTAPIFMLASIPLIFFVFSLRNDVPVVDYDEITEKGILTKGTIVDLTTQNNVTINGEHPTLIHYSYTSNGKEIQSSFKTLDSDKVSNLSAGDAIDVKYLGDDSIIVSLDSFDPFWIFAVAPLIFFLVGFVPIAILWYLVQKQIHLFRYGRVTSAEVLSMKREPGTTGFFFRLAPPSELHYQYKDIAGKMHIGRAKTIDLSLSNSIKTGDTIKIFVSPDDESKSTLIPRLEVVRNNWKID
jgi:hypothetical protein